MRRPPPGPTLFPYTTLFRSRQRRGPRAPSATLLGPSMKLDSSTREPWSLIGEARSEKHTSELQSPDHPVCRLLLEKKNIPPPPHPHQHHNHPHTSTSSHLHC